jgi:hypothetical protein
LNQRRRKFVLKNSIRFSINQFTIKEYNGAIINQKNVHSYYVKDNICIDVHMSKIKYTNEDEYLFKQVLNSLDFIVPYKQQQDIIIPWNSDPAEAHKICGSPATPILYKGLLYKCPAVANAIDISRENWFNYRAYDITDNLQEFVNNINRPEPVCGQCPNKQQAVIIDHFDKNNVKTKNIN